jgi:hypothetical protein
MQGISIGHNGEIVDHDLITLLLITAIPEDAINDESDDEDKSNPDERISIRASDKRIAPDNEYSDSEDEGDGRRDQR